MPVFRIADSPTSPPRATAKSYPTLVSLLMAVGVWFHITEQHEHERVNEPMEHAHPISMIRITNTSMASTIQPVSRTPMHTVTAD
jgi:hypothetical protein